MPWRSENLLETLAAVDGEPCRRKDNKEQLQTDIVFSPRFGQKAKPVQFQLAGIGRSIRSLEANSAKTELGRRYGARDVAGKKEVQQKLLEIQHIPHDNALSSGSGVFGRPDFTCESQVLVLSRLLCELREKCQVAVRHTRFG